MAKQMKGLEMENARHKKLLAEAELDKAILTEAARFAAIERVQSRTNLASFFKWWITACPPPLRGWR